MTTYEELSTSRHSPASSLQSLRDEGEIYESTVERSTRSTTSYNFSARAKRLLSLKEHFSSPAPIQPSWLQKIALCCGVIQILIGVCLISIAIAMGITLKHKSEYSFHHPMIWWAGFAPLMLGGVGMYAHRANQIKFLCGWVTCSVVLFLFELFLFWGVGAFDIASFNVWPFMGGIHGQPVCAEKVGRCYCQDLLSSKHGPKEIAGVQYIHQDIVWRDSGFIRCSDAHLVSALYYAHFGIFASYGLLSLVAFGLCVKGVVSNHSDPVEFEALDESLEFEDSFVINENSITPLRTEFDPEQVEKNIRT